ncbi:unnamed protein product [Darwinula stevensoni]|uniref:Integrin beta n=1 Tax=Darwinula stevensoni TaxID=69355 RepID=A0A7R9A3L3_9CRUS|nr:unnamed protein product [Darwinula stevensoni]CAG0881559.1 unnamed protein product [Darwinula stevensoni]
MEKGSVFIVLCVFLHAMVVFGQLTEKLISNPCTSKDTCHECIQTPTCAWCSQPNFTSPDGSPIPRCNQQNRYLDSQLQARCDPAHIINPSNHYEAIYDYELSKKAHSGKEAIQIRPQRVSLQCRVKEAYDLSLWYAQAEDYPVDLYYLMDLSKSMEDDKEKLSELAILLAKEMEKITSNFKLGFGSFVDKVVMPYVSTVPAKLQAPCDGCAAPYGFKNHMTLGTDSSQFAHEVRSANISGNLDAPEGGFDAIMQAIVCKNTIGWRDRARRLLVFSTDASFHFAGDGKLGGIITPNDGQCHLDHRGAYTHSLLLDYPSVSQINQKVKENSINIIFAVTDQQRYVYDKLSETVEGASSGTLSQDSSNVVELIKDQYNQITSSVEMKDNATSNVQITYFSRCLDEGGPLKQTNRCDGLKVGTKVQFTVRIEVLSCPPNPRDWMQYIQIYPVGINESLIVELKMICDCDCEKPGNPGYKPPSLATECNHHGSLQCGKCVCDDSHFGRFCECDLNTDDFYDNQSGCRPGNSTDILCSNRGNCVCGVCECFKRPNQDEVISGPYCECDNFSCDRHNGLLCSGPEHGECLCGECKCKGNWIGPACGCLNTTDSCYPRDGGEMCSGKGECICGACECIETEVGRYSGKFCQECPTCPGRCEELKPCVQCKTFKSGELSEEECDACPFVPVEVDVAQEENPDERLCTFTDVDECRFYFVYGYSDDTNELIVRVQRTKDCPPVIDILGIVLGVIGAIVALGVAVLLLWKILTTIHDRREFAKFEKERMLAKWDTGENPIFKPSTSTFKNPTYGGK